MTTAEAPRTEARSTSSRIPAEVRYPTSGSIEWRELSTRDKRFLKRAAAFAAKREVDYQNHCAIAVRGSKIVGIGFNSYKNDPGMLSEEHVRVVSGRNSYMGVGPHAETAALSQLTNTEGVTIYVARLLRTGEVGNSAPCEGCQLALRKAGVKRVVWTEDAMSL